MSKLKQACTRDTKFVHEVRLTTKVAYVSVEVPIKSWVSLNPKPPRTGHSKGWLKSLVRSLDWSEDWGREVLSSKKVGSKCFHVNWVANQAEGAWGSFIAPQKESAYWGVSGLDMSSIGDQTCPTIISVTRPWHQTCPVSGLNSG
jgi:hypothetical protein